LRMRVKGDHAAEEAFFPCSLLEPVDQVVMPGMHAIKDPNSEHGFPLWNQSS